MWSIREFPLGVKSHSWWVVPSQCIINYRKLVCSFIWNDLVIESTFECVRGRRNRESEVTQWKWTRKKKLFFTFHGSELKNYELTFTFPAIFISCSQWKIVEKKKKAQRVWRKRFSSIKRSKKTRIDENAFQDILTSKMNCLFIDNTLDERKKEINRGKIRREKLSRKTINHKRHFFSH